MSDRPQIVAVTDENRDQLTQQMNTASIPLNANEILALRRLLKVTEGADALTQNQGGGGGGMSENERIARLETHFQYIQRDLGDLKSGQQAIAKELSGITTALSSLATKSDLSSWKLQWTGICVAAIALIVGGIIGGLGWIKPDAAPVIIQSGAGQNSTSPTVGNQPRPATPDAPAPRP